MAKAQKGKTRTVAEGSGLLVEAAKAIGGLAGKVASAVGAGHSAQPAGHAATRQGRLVKKNKSRLPRRQKKVVQKKAAAARRRANSTF